MRFGNANIFESFKYYENDFQKACFAPGLRVGSGGRIRKSQKLPAGV